MLNQLRPALLLLFALSLITGLAYPLVVTGIAQVVLPLKANGSLIIHDGQPIGSALIGQPFDDPGYFWGRPSATTPFPYNAARSQGSNLGPTNEALIARIEATAAALRAADPGNDAPIPIDLVTASASGLDPHISMAGALYQAPRVARARGMAEAELRDLIEHHAIRSQLGIFGELRVNVLELNLALDALQQGH